MSGSYIEMSLSILKIVYTTQQWLLTIGLLVQKGNTYRFMSNNLSTRLVCELGNVLLHMYVLWVKVVLNV